MRKPLLAVCLSLLPGLLCATSLRTVNPVAGVKKFKIEFSIGGPMHLDFANTTDLFRDSRLRAEAFERRVRDGIAKKFAERGIVVDPAATHTMLIGIWGRPITEANCEQLSVALIEASFHDERILSEPGYQGQSTVTWGRNLIEVASDEQLDDSLEAAILQLAGEVLQRGTGKDD
jgi:hypothetical protein